jgi:hypothetical protein
MFSHTVDVRGEVVLMFDLFSKGEIGRETTLTDVANGILE